MKKLFVLLIAVLISVLFISCSTPKSFIFYHSEASIPQESSSITTEFYFVGRISQSLPFGIIAATDKNKSNNIVEYYVLLSKRKYMTNSVEDYVHPYNVTLRAENVNELIENIDKALKLYDLQIDETKGINIEYILSKEHKIKQVSKDVESWEPDFKFIFKDFTNTKEAYVNLGLLHNADGNIDYSYYLDEYQIIELKNRLSKAIDMLRNLGLK
jgi:hypothetical protein